LILKRGKVGFGKKFHFSQNSNYRNERGRIESRKVIDCDWNKATMMSGIDKSGAMAGLEGNFPSPLKVFHSL
jgi:hypothetical protein